MSENPALKLIKLIEAQGATRAYYGPFLSSIPMIREHADIAGRDSVARRENLSTAYAAVLIVTDRDGADYPALVRHALVLGNTQNACRKAGVESERVVLA